MVDVALATSAAPTFLPAHHTAGLRLVDGGVWAGNPAALAVAEARSLFGRELDDIHVLSIGTTVAVHSRRRRLDAGGKLQWAGDAVEVLSRAQSLGTNGLVQHLIGDHLLRIDQPVPAGALQMDALDRDQLLGRAEGVSRQVSPAVKRGFFEHVGQPLHRQPNT